MTPDEQVNLAWRRGYEAGITGKDVRCPYDAPRLYGPWISGNAAGFQDYSSSRGLADDLCAARAAQSPRAA
jgi:ribosome modulation factor